MIHERGLTFRVSFSLHTFLLTTTMLQYDTPEWMPSQLLPFFTLSYPTSTPVNPDSFPDSKYYLYGYQDLCFVITLIAIMAVLRDAFRLLVFEPFARWKLNRDFRLRSKAVANGNGVNGKGHSTKPTALEKRKIHRRVLRFAEQGWSVVYYPAQLLFGLVRLLTFYSTILLPDPLCCF